MIRATFATILICSLSLLTYAGDINSDLRKAAEKGKIDELQRLLKEGASVDGIDAKGRSALYVAVSKQHIEAAQYLIEQGANPTLRDNKGQSALDIADHSKHTDMIELLEYAFAKFSKSIDAYALYFRNFPDGRYLSNLEEGFYRIVVLSSDIEAYRMYCQLFRGTTHLSNAQSLLLQACLAMNADSVQQLVTSGSSLAQCELAEFLLIHILHSSISTDIKMSISAGGKMDASVGGSTNDIGNDTFSLLLFAGTNPNSKCIVGFKKAWKEELIRGKMEVLHSGEPGYVSSTCGEGAMSALEFARANDLNTFEQLLAVDLLQNPDKAGSEYVHDSQSFTTTSSNTVTDIDGNVYQTVTIGTQVWMKENLKVTHYRNGDAIPNVTDGPVWAGLTTKAYCEYNNNLSNVATYGRLYNWYAVSDSRNIAPTGWHVPTDAEWRTLSAFLGGFSVAGGKLKEAGRWHWVTPNTGATNGSGFSALPGGSRDFSDGTYFGLGSQRV